ncbi:MAG: hypothetical protein ABIG11_09670 [bacterium]
MDLIRFAPVLLLLLVLPPARTAAQCTYKFDCAGGYGTRTSKNFPDKSSCDSAYRDSVRKLNSMGGGCTPRACVCSGGASGSGQQYIGGGFSLEDAIKLELVGAVSNAMGQAITGFLTPSSGGKEALEAERAYFLQQENARILERQHQANYAEEQRKQAIENEKDDLLSGMKGSGSGNLAMKGADSSRSGELDFKEYHEREQERREVLEKLPKGWCLKRPQPPLFPTKPFFEIPAGAYKGMVEFYHVKREAWLKVCDDMDAKSTSAGKKAVTKLQAKHKPSAMRALSKACSFCYAGFKKGLGACGPMPTDLERLQCTNRHLADWSVCLERCQAVPDDPAKLVP